MKSALGQPLATVIIKKSKFLGWSFDVNSTSEVKDILAYFKKEYADARHIVYAYRLKEQGILREKFDNDKEPSSSAGQPLLYLLQKKELMDKLVVVVRYFGGTKLGVGGLIRAYTQAGQEALGK